MPKLKSNLCIKRYGIIFVLSLKGVEVFKLPSAYLKLPTKNGFS